MNFTKLSAKEAKMPINQLYTAEKMRKLTSSYKRHTIQRLIRPENQTMRGATFQQRIKQNVGDFFFVYCRQVIPRIEQSIELNLLEKFTQNITNPLERQEVIGAYMQRRENLAKMPDDDGLGDNKSRGADAKKTSLDDFWKVIQNVDGDGLRYHTIHDIGRFTVFPKNHFKRMFPGRTFGELERSALKYNDTYGIMTREEGLRLTNQFDQLTLPHERNVEWMKFARMDNAEFKRDVLHDEKVFLNIYQDMSLAINDYLNKESHSAEFKNKVKNFYTPASLFDSIATILVCEMRRKPFRQVMVKPEARQAIVNYVVAQIYDRMVKAGRDRPQKFGEVCEEIRSIDLWFDKSWLHEEFSSKKTQVDIDEDKQELLPEQIELDKQEPAKIAKKKNMYMNYRLYLSGYHKICNQLWRPIESRRISIDDFKGMNTGIMFWGERGCGKSQLLTYLTAWAHEKQWMVVTVPSCEEISGGDATIFRYKNGLYLQEELAHRLLGHFKHSNEQNLLDFDVDLKRYGQYDITGVKDTEPQPDIPVWDPLRKCWSDEWKNQLFDLEVKMLETKYEEMEYRMKDKLPEPKKLIEVVDMGLEDPKLATNAFAEVLEQLYNTDQFQVMMAVDGFNDWLKPSGYPSFRYENSKVLRGHIPPQDICLIRLFMKFDGHFIRNGVKLMATTHLRQFNHVATPEMINFQHGYCRRVENMALNDFRNALKYYYITGWSNNKSFRESEIENYFMTSQGNWTQFHQHYTNYYFNLYY